MRDVRSADPQQAGGCRIRDRQLCHVDRARLLGERLADPDALLAPVEHLGYWLTPREAGVVVGRRLGVQRVLAQVLLADKQAEVAALEAAGEVVAVVGDGINDAPALVQDDLGSAIGTGTDVAIQSRDLALMPADLARIPTAISLSRRIYRTIVHTLYWAFGCNIVAVPLAAAGLLNPIISGAARGFSSAGVVTNSLCLLQFER
ncbi:hypothetical protein [Mycobacterium szulgai]|uniref:hypothetical protein n=1 Tax=Mycobacterium szulgai TaxID=1787 RepID=UPI0021F2C828|nr:hypothetical protein [Mycobacterium szulgai]MCV7075782.1 hypothetical protein [Mycobacterium szulgai]